MAENTTLHSKNQSDFMTRLKQGTILADGATGTMLNQTGKAADACYEALNLSDPFSVEQIHRQYLAAGAELIETNTYGANRYKLAAYDQQDNLTAINRAGVELTRRAIEAHHSHRPDARPAYIAGAVGPLGVRIAPYGRLKPEAAFEAFYEHIEVLVSAGIDCLLFETFTDLNELTQAVNAARAVNPRIPIIAEVTFMRDGQTLYGETPAEAAEKLVELGVEVAGANCSVGPSQMARIARAMHLAAPGLPLCVMPNAGFPERIGGRMMYPATPDYFADYALTLRDLGVGIIGGCCGTTPEHVHSMRVALDAIGRQPRIELADSIAPDEVITTDLAPNRLQTRLADGKFVVTVEMAPPRSFSAQKVIASAQMLQDAGVDMVDISDSPMARMRMSPWAVCHLIQTQINMDTILHFPTRGRNMLRVQGDLLAAHALGIRNVFVVMGDPTHIGDYPEANDKYDIVPSGLMKLIKQNLNTGTDQAGNSIGQPTSFLVGCALNMGAADLDAEIKTLVKKIDSGADFALTQTIYDVRKVETFLSRFRELHGDLKLPLLVGVLPLYGAKHAAFLHNEVPGIDIPEVTRHEIDAAGDTAPEVGVRLACELLRDLRGMVQGAYLMPPFGKYEMAAEITESLVGVHC